MPMTWGETFTFLPRAGWIGFDVLTAAVGAPFRGKDDAPTAGEHISRAGMRSMINTLSAAQLQAMIPPFSKTYDAWCKTNKVTPRTDQIPNTNIVGYWIGEPSSAKYIQVFYHGGGFIIPGNVHHVSLAARMTKWSNKEIAVFCPDYTLAPQGVYPLQIGQSVEALRYVLSLPGVTPDKVLLAGDSVGGNLVIAVLSHISGHPHPNPEVVKPLQITSPLKSALTTCAWTSGDTQKFDSFEKLKNKDMAPPTFTDHWQGLYRGSLPVEYQDEYMFPESAPAGWWSNLNVRSYLACVGGGEALKDPTLSWAEKVKQGLRQSNANETKFKLVVGENEIHLAAMDEKSDQELDRLGEKVQEAALRNWIYDLVGRSHKL